MSIFTEISAIQYCGIQMKSNATYIRRELPSLELSDSLKKQIEDLCDHWVSCEQNVGNELGEISETETETFNEAANRKIAMARQWLLEATMKAKPCLDAINEAVAAGTAQLAIQILVMESATNVLNSLPPAPSPANGEL